MSDNPQIEALARRLLSWKYGQDYEGDSLVDSTETIFTTPNSRAVGAVRMAREIGAQLESLQGEADIAKGFHDVAVQQRDAAWRTEAAICQALGLPDDAGRQVPEDIHALLAFARRGGLLYRHKNGGLYQEMQRRVWAREYETQLREGATLWTQIGQAVVTCLVTDDIRADEEYVVYRNAKGDHFARPTRLFDEPDRFKELT